MMVIFLCGLVALILLRTLRQDYAKVGWHWYALYLTRSLYQVEHLLHGADAYGLPCRPLTFSQLKLFVPLPSPCLQYMREDDDLESVDKGGIGMGGDESGWKQVHGEVFRRPPHLALFSALIGTGYQLVVMIFFAILFAITGSVYSRRFSMTLAFVLVYATTSFIAGYTSGSYYRSHFYPDPSPNWYALRPQNTSLHLLLLLLLVTPSWLGCLVFVRWMLKNQAVSTFGGFSLLSCCPTAW